MTTDADFVIWARKDNQRRVILAELDYMYQVGTGVSAVPTLGTLYFSNFAYTDASVPRLYLDAIVSVPNYSRSLDRATLSGRFSSSVSSLELANADGALDYLLDLAMDGSDIRFYVGDETWIRSDFVRMFTAMSAKATAPSFDRISIALKDTSLLLNKSIGGTVAVGGTGPSKDRFRKYHFGYVHQVEPISSNSATLTYAHSDTGTRTAAVAVRNNGVAVSFVENADGTFTLLASPAGGAITCDVLAYASPGVYAYKLSDAMSEIVGTRAGLTALSKFYGPDGTYVTFGNNDYHIGIEIADKRNVIDILDDLTTTANGFWAINRSGQFYYGRMRPDALDAILSGIDGMLTLAGSIVADDIVRGSFRLDHNLPTYSSYQLLANLNWTAQSSFASSLDAATREQYTRKGLPNAAYYGEEPTSTAYLGASASYQGGAPQLYDLSLSGSQITSTLISGATDTAVFDPSYPSFDIIKAMADWSAVRRSQHLPWMEFVDITVGLEFYGLEIGNIVNFTMTRFGLDAGKLYQVCAVNMVLSKAQIQLGLVRRRFASTASAATTSTFFLLQLNGSDILELGTTDKLKIIGV